MYPPERDLLQHIPGEKLPPMLLLCTSASVHVVILLRRGAQHWNTCLEPGTLVIDLFVAFLAAGEAVSEGGVLTKVKLFCLHLPLMCEALFACPKGAGTYKRAPFVVG